ncbi:hypothetical protein E8E14_007478 [Neopestalotiopsis sp. 37M]|nr:hypothetical protein E8E14_007478 [Neopestalotiopsis sp. 37M]
MKFSQQILVCIAAIAPLALVEAKIPVPKLRGHRVRQDDPTPCTASTVETVTTINRGNEGIWHVRANQTGLNQLYQFSQVDWMSNDKTAVLDQCTSTCLAGNNTETPGSWLPSEKYFQGAFVNTPGGTGQDPLWMCACFDGTLSQDNLVSGGGVSDNSNPGSGTIINRVC